MTEECWIFITDLGKCLSCFCLKAVLGIGPDCRGKNLWLNLLETQCYLWNGSNKTRVKLCGNVYHAWHRASVEYMATFIIISSKMLNKLLLFARSYARGQECSAEQTPIQNQICRTVIAWAETFGAAFSNTACPCLPVTFYLKSCLELV